MQKSFSYSTLTHTFHSLQTSISSPWSLYFLFRLAFYLHQTPSLAFSISFFILSIVHTPHNHLLFNPLCFHPPSLTPVKSHLSTIFSSFVLLPSPPSPSILMEASPHWYHFTPYRLSFTFTILDCLPSSSLTPTVPSFTHLGISRWSVYFLICLSSHLHHPQSFPFSTSGLSSTSLMLHIHHVSSSLLLSSSLHQRH